jgi:putative Mg2+ transporter-C (MgtC) family protein
MEEYQIYLDYGLRLITALVLSGWIGYDRSKKSRAAGLRTHALVGTASALVMLTSEFMFIKYATAVVAPDPARLGAQIISGIGFLGAGTIIQSKGSVKGLTTAASLWSVGTIGIAAGVGFYPGAIATTFLIYILLRFASIIEGGWLINRIETRRVFIQTTNPDLELYQELASEHQVYVDKMQFMGSDYHKDSTLHYLLITLNPRARNMDNYFNLLKAFGNTKGIVKVKVIGETLVDQE